MIALRILFMGTPEFSVPTLAALLNGPDDVVGVVTQPDRPSGRKRRLTSPPVKQLAIEHGVPVFQPDRLRGDDIYQTLRALEPDAGVVVAYGQILRQRFLDLPRHGCFNIHASLLPRWRGAAPINWAIAAGDRETGVTIMQMERGLDTGPMIEVVKLSIRPDETAGDLHNRMAPIGAEAMMTVLGQLRAGHELTLTPQDNEASTYARLLSKADGWVDFNMGPVELVNHARGMTPWPGARCQTAGGTLRLARLEVASENSAESNADVRPGTVIRGREGRLEIAVNGGSIRVMACQKPGKRVLDASAYLNGLVDSPEGQLWRGRGDVGTDND